MKRLTLAGMAMATDGLDRWLKRRVHAVCSLEMIWIQLKVVTCMFKMIYSELGCPVNQ